ncbi:MAG: sodium-dependent bicarbonate transport family permease [Myxococcota bacterium]
MLLFFTLGFFAAILRIPLKLPPPIKEALTLYLLLAIGWHGGEEIARLEWDRLTVEFGFLGVGFVTNLLIGGLSYLILRHLVKLDRLNASAVAGHYGSDSAGTFVTALGVLSAAHIASSPTMPVMLAVMEIPGCVIALWLVSRLRRDSPREGEAAPSSRAVWGEILGNPGLYLLFGGIVMGTIASVANPSATERVDLLFVDLFQPLLCLFLLDLGVSAASRLRDLRGAGPRFIAFGLLAPNLFAGLGILVAHSWSMSIGVPMDLGTYVLFAVLCGSASYIALPALQRMAFPDASPTLPLAASLGLTFTYNVTLGIPLYMWLSQRLLATLPVA